MNNDEKRKLIEDALIAGRSYDEIANSIKVSKSRISRIKRDLLFKGSVNNNDNARIKIKTDKKWRETLKALSSLSDTVASHGYKRSADIKIKTDDKYVKIMFSMPCFFCIFFSCYIS